MEVCKDIFQNVTSDYRALFKVPWYKQVGESARSLVPTPYYDHIFDHREEYNIYVELPITLLVKFHNERISSPILSLESYEELLLHRLPATTKEAPMALVIQSWIDTSNPSKVLTTAPQQFFLLENEEDNQFVITAVMREFVRVAWRGSSRLQHLASSESVETFPDIKSFVTEQINRTEFPRSWQATGSDLSGEVLSDFVNKKIADNSLKMISHSQFDDILLERGHASKSAHHGS